VLLSGTAIRIILPNGKEVAAWCGTPKGIARLFTTGDLDLHWGERPFRQPPLRTVPLADGGSTVEWDSYIRQGGVTTWTGGPGQEIELFVEPYRITLREEGAVKKTLPVQVKVRRITEKERVGLLPPTKQKEYFLVQLRSKDSAVRIEAMQALAGLDFRSRGILKRVADRAVIEKVRELLKNRDAKVIEAAEEALCQLGDTDLILRRLTPEPTKALKDLGGENVARWCEGLPCDKIVNQVLTFFGSKDAELRGFAIDFFSGSEHTPARKALLKALEDSSPKNQLRAAWAVRPFASKDAAPVIARLVGHSERAVCLEALRAADRFRSPAITGAVLKRVEDKDAEIREEAIDALQGSRGPKVEAALLKSSRDKVARVRARAATGLGINQASGAYSRLIQMLEDENAEVRVEVLNGLRRLGDRRAIPVIKKHLDGEKTPSVREMGIRAIRHLEINR
jgi:HEAT repeat protein